MSNRPCKGVCDAPGEKDATKDRPRNREQTASDKHSPDGARGFLASLFIFLHQLLLPLRSLFGLLAYAISTGGHAKLLGRVGVSAAAERGDDSVVGCSSC